MSHELVLRTVAVGLAVAILAAPYRRVVADALAAGIAACRANAATIGRVAAAALIVAAAWGKVPLPSFERAVVPAVVLETPSTDMQALVAPVRAALAALPASKRALWAETWSKAAIVAKAEGTTATPVLIDTPSLRAFTTISLDVAWRRIGNHAPGDVAGLREAVETAMRSAIGLDSVPATRAVLDRYAEVANAIAWAGG